MQDEHWNAEACSCLWWTVTTDAVVNGHFHINFAVPVNGHDFSFQAASSKWWTGKSGSPARYSSSTT